MVRAKHVHTFGQVRAEGQAGGARWARSRPTRPTPQWYRLEERGSEGTKHECLSKIAFLFLLMSCSDASSYGCSQVKAEFLVLTHAPREVSGSGIP